MALSKVKLSGSTDFKGIKVAANSSPGTTIHTAPAGSGQDEVYAWASNPDLTADYDLTLENGGTTDPDDRVVITIPRKGGWIPVMQGQIVTNSNVLKAFGSTANKIVIAGFVIRNG